MRAAKRRSGLGPGDAFVEVHEVLLLMRVGVELMMTNISVAKIVAAAIEMTQGTKMDLASAGWVRFVEIERGRAGAGRQ